jgi:hypothetical protein
MQRTNHRNIRRQRPCSSATWYGCDVVKMLARLRRAVHRPIWGGVAAAVARAVALARTLRIALTTVPRSSSGATVRLLRRRVFIATARAVSHDSGSRHYKDECERQNAARGAKHGVQSQRILEFARRGQSAYPRGGTVFPGFLQKINRPICRQVGLPS